MYHIHHNTARLPKFEKMKPSGTIYTTSLDIPPQDFQQGFPGSASASSGSRLTTRENFGFRSQAFTVLF